jgi:hypothetical protein
MGGCMSWVDEEGRWEMRFGDVGVHVAVPEDDVF